MHKAKAVVVTCMDFRFHNNVQHFLTEQGYLGSCDEIVIAGASRDFIKPVKPQHGRYVWRQLELSMKLHDPEEIVFIDHQDCGGYAQDGLICGGLSEDADKMEHQQFLGKLAKKLQKKFPGKKLIFYYACLNGEIVKLSLEQRRQNNRLEQTPLNESLLHI